MSTEKTLPEAGAKREKPFGRGEKVRAIVLQATIDELIAGGYEALAVENVAARAGVHKTTVYRRWKTRNRLVVDALGVLIQAEIPVPNSGSFDDDLHTLAAGFVRWVTSPSGQAIVGTMLSNEDEITMARREFYEDRFGRAGVVVTRAVERGELPADTEPVEVLRTLLAPIYFRLLVLPEPVDISTARHAANLAIAAARAGLLTRANH